jgi:hypothetical protein
MREVQRLGQEIEQAPVTQEALKLALEFVKSINLGSRSASVEQQRQVITAIKEALAQTQEPAAWLLTDKNINSLQVDSIQRLINRLNHAHHTDLCVRINGQDEWFQADWLKHMVRATPPQRTWVELEKKDMPDGESPMFDHEYFIAGMVFAAKVLKEKNT